MYQIPTNCPQCPQCLGYTVRIHRRLSDRLISLVTPVQRYQCQKYFCGWEGSLRLNDLTRLPMAIRTKIEPEYNASAKV